MFANFLSMMLRTGAWFFVSALTSVTSSSKRMISSATASISQPALRVSPNRAAYVSRLPPTIRFEARSRSTLPIWGNRTSRILHDRSGPTRRAGMYSSPERKTGARSTVYLPRRGCRSWSCRSRTLADPEQDYFVDGVTESLTTELTLIAGAFVIARNTAFTFKGKAVDVKRIGRELNVRYALEGSVQRSGNRLRVNVQLIDAETGNHLWADRFDKPLADLFDMQDEIVSRLSNALDARLMAAEARRAANAPHPSSMDAYFQGRAYLYKGTPEYMGKALESFTRSLALDSQNGEALAGQALAHTVIGTTDFTGDRVARFAAAEAAATKAI